MCAYGVGVLGAQGVGDVRTRYVYVGDVPMCVCVCVSMQVGVWGLPIAPVALSDYLCVYVNACDVMYLCMCVCVCDDDVNAYVCMRM